MTNEGSKGPQTTVLTPGFYRLNRYLWDVQYGTLTEIDKGTVSVHRRDAHGWPLKLPGPHIAVAALVPLIPGNDYRPVTVREQTYWCFTLGVRIPGLVRFGRLP